MVTGFLGDFVSQVASKIKELSDDNLVAQVTTKVKELSEDELIARVSTKVKELSKVHLPKSKSSHDVVYVTDRLLASSQPSEPIGPTYEDKGRDTYWDMIDFKMKKNIERKKEEQLKGRIPAELTDEGDQMQKSKAQEAGECTIQTPTVGMITPLTPPLTTKNEENIKINALHSAHEIIPSSSVATQDFSSSLTINETANIPITATDTPTMDRIAPSRSIPVADVRWNSPATLATFLEKRHNSKFLAFHLVDNPPNDRTLLLLRRQIIQFSWKSPCSPRSETPALSQILDICYAMHAFLELSPQNVVLVYCANGKTRTAIVLACYLKFIGHFHQSRDGFIHFLRKTMPESKNNDNYQHIFDNLPPSLHTFFRNFDDCVELSSYINSKPLLLRAIALQGVPVEDKPCIDIWDGRQRHVYSSHPDLWNDLVQTNPIINQYGGLQSPFANQQQLLKNSSQWADEEGFYKVNTIIEGDFCLLCRFGGPHAESSHDTSKILFRYANTTGFLGAGGPYELPPSKVDMMRRYEEFFEEDEFLLSLVFEAHWNCESPEESKVLQRNCSEKSLPKVLHGDDAKEKGWHLITKCHSARPVEIDLERFINNFHTDLNSCPHHVISLALQISNFDWHDAHKQLIKGLFQSWWNKSGTISPLVEKITTLREEKKEEVEVDFETIASKDKISSNDEKQPSDAMHNGITNILNVLDNVDITSRLRKFEGKYLDTGGVTQAVSEKQESCFALTNPTFPSNLTGNMTSTQNRDGHVQNYNTEENSINSSMESLSSGLGYYNPGIMTPHTGDVMNAFGAYYNQFHGLVAPQCMHFKNDCIKGSAKRQQRPQMPVLQRNQPFSQRFFGSMRKNLESTSAMDNPRNTIAAEMLMKIDHPAIGLKDLTQLLEESKSTWNQHGEQALLAALKKQSDDVRNIQTEEASIVDANDKGIKKEAAAADIRSAKNKATLPPPGMSVAAAIANGKMKSTATTTKKVKPPVTNIGGATAAAAKGKSEKERPPVMNTGKIVAAAAKKRRPPVMNIGAAAAAAAKEKSEKERTSVTNIREAAVAAAKKERPPSMNIGAAVTAAAKKKRPPVMNIGAAAAADKRKNSEDAKKKDNKEDAPLKDDPEFAKYFKMLRLKMPKEQVMHALTRDGKDMTILDLDPTKSLKSQREKKTVSSDDGPALKDDPEYSKYFKMLKLGMPHEQVMHALTRDGKDPSIIKMDPNKSLKLQQQKSGDIDNGPPLKDDPEYTKYFKMLKLGMPKELVKHALTRDNKDPAIVDMDPMKSLKSQKNGEKEQLMDEGPPLKEDPEFLKYFNMLKIGLPKGAVQNALTRDGKDPSIMDLDPEKSLKSQLEEPEEKDLGIPLKEDPTYVKYFKMLSMGLPKGAVANALQRDGKDPGIIELDPEKSLELQTRKKNGGRRTKSSKKSKTRVRRKKIYWNPIEPHLIREGSIWNLVRGSVRMDKLEYDVKEFEELFTESADPKDRKKQRKKESSSKKQKKSQQVIDGKRSMNGGIILIRLRMDYKAIANMVDKMESGNLDATQLKALKEFVPTSDEREGLVQYMKQGEKSDEAKAVAYADLSECEKYMTTIMDVPRVEPKFDCMLFQTKFRERFDELLDSIRVIEQACDQVRNSEKLQKVMAMILSLVNQINTGGESSGDHGFSLDALLKLNESKAFDKKTSVLHYLAKLVSKNDLSLLELKADLSTVPEAELVVLDTICCDIKELYSELSEVHKTATEEADRLEAANKLEPLPSSEAKDQAMGKNSGRTKMECFTKDAGSAIRGALESTDIVKGKYANLLEYFGEDAKKASNGFFGLIKRFVIEFEQAAGQVEKIEKARLKEIKREQQRLAKKKKQAEKQRVKQKKENGKITSKQITNSTASMIATGEGNTDGDFVAGLTKKNDKKINKHATAPKNKTKEADEINHSPGGIAAMAAAAAKRITQKVEQSNPSIGDIAAMAAATAAKKKAKTIDKGILPVVGIAAMAAAAAKKNAKEVDKNALPAGGIAVMAAAAAAKKKTKVIDEGIRPAGGIAAMAAAAATAKKRSKKVDGIIPPAYGIAGIAAAAAVKKNTKNAEESVLPVGNIAAMAAANTAKKKAKKVDKNALPAGDIAAMAAADAKKKAKKVDEGNPSAVGIAALTAAATAKKKTKVIDEGIRPAGGIAAMAAAAAKKRSKKVDENISSADGITATGTTAAAAVKKNTKNADESVLPVGGIAGMAAAAAKKKAKKFGKSFLSVGGIAGIAAAAAKKKTSKFDTNTVPTCGIAVSAAAAAKKKAKEVDPIGISAGRIAAMAAAAAKKRTQKIDGIAAMATAAATKKNLETFDESVPHTGSIVAIPAAKGANQVNETRLLTGDVAAMACATAAQENTKENYDSFPTDGIATMTTTAAKMKTQEDEKIKHSDGDIVAASGKKPNGGIAAMVVAKNTEKRIRAKIVPDAYDYSSMVAATAVTIDATETFAMKNEIGGHVPNENIAKQPQNLKAQRLASMKNAATWSAFKVTPPESPKKQG